MKTEDFITDLIKQRDIAVDKRDKLTAEIKILTKVIVKGRGKP